MSRPNTYQSGKKVFLCQNHDTEYKWSQISSKLTCNPLNGNTNCMLLITPCHCFCVTMATLWSHPSHTVLQCSGSVSWQIRWCYCHFPAVKDEPVWGFCCWITGCWERLPFISLLCCLGPRTPVLMLWKCYVNARLRHVIFQLNIHINTHAKTQVADMLSRIELGCSRQWV